MGQEPCDWSAFSRRREAPGTSPGCRGNITYLIPEWVREVITTDENGAYRRDCELGKRKVTA